MAFITFVHLSVENFTSWAKLDFVLEGQGCVCLRGLNGSGKSSIFKALYWCLFGTLPDPVKADEIRGGKAPTKVTLTMRKGGKEYVLTRHRGHTLYKNRIEFTGPGLPSTDADSMIKDVQALINTFLGITPDVFLTTTLFAQRNFHVFHTLSDTGKKEWLESNTYGTLFTECERLIREQTRTLERSIDYDEGKLIGLKESLQSVHADIETKRAALQKHLAIVNKQRKDWKAKQDVTNDELTPLIKIPAQLRKAQDDVDDKASLLDVLVHDFEKLKDSLYECPTCGSKFDPAKRRQELQVLAPKVDQARLAFATANRELQRCEKALETYNELYERIEECQQEIRVLITERNRIEKELKDLERTSDIEKSIIALEKSLSYQKRKLTYFKFWVHGFGFQGLRTYALQTAARYLLEQLRYYLGKLTGTRFLVDLEFINNRIAITFNDRSYSTLSGGERQAVDISTGFALRDVAERYNKARFNLIVLDEPFENLDDTLTTAAQKLLLETERDSTFFITHRSITGRFDKILRVSKLLSHSRLSIAS